MPPQGPTLWHHAEEALPPAAPPVGLPPGPRQTGKSTLVRSLLPPRSWTVDLLQQDVFLRYAKDPSRFRLEVEAQARAGVRVVFVDEIQRVPALLEEIHGLIESHRVRFLLTGSSARKLRRGAANLLAGRAATRRLHPLTLSEQGELFDLERTLRYGSLPAVVTGSVAEYASWLSTTPLPKLMLHAEPGLAATKATVRLAQRRIASLEVQSIGGGKHFLPEDQPDRLGRAIADFASRGSLRAQDSASSTRRGEGERLSGTPAGPV